jgi:membrane-bound ClpP family serine protease
MPMGAGLSLIVIGALLAFAVEDDVSGINLGIAGLILMIAGAAVLVIALIQMAMYRDRDRAVAYERGDPRYPPR